MDNLREKTVKFPANHLKSITSVAVTIASLSRHTDRDRPLAQFTGILPF